MRWGILGSGKIASDFATALKTVPGAELQAVASRRTGPADEFAARFGMPQALSGSDWEIGLIENFNFKVDTKPHGEARNES